MNCSEFSKVIALAVAGVVTMAGGWAFAAPRLCDDGTRPPCKDNEVPDYGDLIIILRDEDGVPILTADSCWQPIGFPSELCPDTCMVDGIVTVDPATCAVVAGCALCTQEVDFGRINEARSPDDVFEDQLEDVLIKMATADCVTLDPAGRLVASTVASDGAVSSSTVDSPLQNLAIYRQLMMTGTLGVPLPQGADALDTAARGLGAASDKAGEVNVDMVAYLNQIMGLSDPDTPTLLGKICIDVKEEVMGEVQLVEKCFLNYGEDTVDAEGELIIGADYAYNRATNFGALPAPAYIPEGYPEEGWFEYMVLILEEPPTFGIEYGPIMDAVFDGDPGFTDGNLGGFAQATDDTRAVINFMHENQVWSEYVTPVPCEASGETTYDVSISPVSGLQVPKNIVDGSEGREFTVTVANAGPDAATGSVTVIAVAANGGLIEGSPWVYDFTELVGGASTSFVQFFAIDLGEKTTIDWEATAYAPDDVNLSNNTVTATSNVKVTSGGGGGGGH